MIDWVSTCVCARAHMCIHGGVCFMVAEKSLSRRLTKNPAQAKKCWQRCSSIDLIQFYSTVPMFFLNVKVACKIFIGYVHVSPIYFLFHLLRSTDLRIFTSTSSNLLLSLSARCFSSALVVSYLDNFNSLPTNFLTTCVASLHLILLLLPK